VIDRETRDKLIELINKFINCKISAFEFDELLFSDDNSIEAIESKDKTIDFIIYQLWLFYDDIKDHDADLSKPSWDYIQRLILILKSDAQTEVKNKKTKLYTQFIALIMLIALVIVIYYFDFISIPFFITWVIGALLSFLIQRYKDKIETNESECNNKNIHIYPFESYSQISYLAKINNFKKNKFYQRKTGKAPTYSKTLIWLGYLVHWPIVMLLNTLPVFNSHIVLNTECICDSK
jgi:hypothetical protein